MNEVVSEGTATGSEVDRMRTAIEGEARVG
jgi:hypothetical protein